MNTLVEDPAVDGQAFDIEVNEGVVSLTGKVDSWAEKELAGQLAIQVRGVIDLENDLAVPYTRTRPDQEIQQDVTRRLKMDAWLEGRLLNVEVEEGYGFTVHVFEGTAYLAGTVDRYFEKGEATEVVARVKGGDRGGQSDSSPCDLGAERGLDYCGGDQRRAVVESV